MPKDSAVVETKQRTLPEIVEASALEALKEGISRVPFSVEDWATFNDRAQNVYQREVLPVLSGKGPSSYPHRNLCTAVVEILRSNRRYKEELIVERKEEHGHTSIFKAIVLHRRSSFRCPRWLVNPPNSLFAFATVYHKNK